MKIALRLVITLMLLASTIIIAQTPTKITLGFSLERLSNDFTITTYTAPTTSSLRTDWGVQYFISGDYRENLETLLSFSAGALFNPNVHIIFGNHDLKISGLFGNMPYVKHRAAEISLGVCGGYFDKNDMPHRLYLRLMMVSRKYGDIIVEEIEQDYHHSEVVALHSFHDIISGVMFGFGFAINWPCTRPGFHGFGFLEGSFGKMEVNTEIKDLLNGLSKNSVVNVSESQKNMFLLSNFGVGINYGFAHNISLNLGFRLEMFGLYTTKRAFEKGSWNCRGLFVAINYSFL